MDDDLQRLVGELEAELKRRGHSRGPCGMRRLVVYHDRGAELETEMYDATDLDDDVIDAIAALTSGAGVSHDILVTFGGPKYAPLTSLLGMYNLVHGPAIRPEVKRLAPIGAQLAERFLARLRAINVGPPGSDSRTLGGLAQELRAVLKLWGVAWPPWLDVAAQNVVPNWERHEHEEAVQAWAAKERART